MRGTPRFSSALTAGPATAPSTAARMTGMTIVDVWSSNQMTPTMTSTKPTSSHDEKPSCRSHAGADAWIPLSVLIRSSCRFAYSTMVGG